MFSQQHLFYPSRKWDLWKGLQKIWKLSKRPEQCNAECIMSPPKSLPVTDMRQKSTMSMPCLQPLWSPLTLSCLSGSHWHTIPLALEAAFRSEGQSENQHIYLISIAWKHGRSSSKVFMTSTTSQRYQCEIQYAFNCFAAFSWCKISAHPNTFKNNNWVGSF